LISARADSVKSNRAARRAIDVRRRPHPSPWIGDRLPRLDWHTQISGSTHG
jgi:hypothetical protein